MNKKSTRLSGTQKTVLYVLYGLAVRKNHAAPVPAMQLLNMLNLVRSQHIADTNFRRSCHTLVEHGYLNKYRDRQSLKLAFSLTAAGEETAGKIYEERLSEME